MKKEKREKHTWYLVRYMQAPIRLYKSEVRASVLRVKTPCEQGVPHCTYVLQAGQRLLRRRRRRSAVSPWNVDPLRSTTLRGIRSTRSGFRSFLCPTPKVTPRSSLDDVGEARWPLSHIKNVPQILPSGQFLKYIKKNVLSQKLY